MAHVPKIAKTNNLNTRQVNHVTTSHNSTETWGTGKVLFGYALLKGVPHNGLFILNAVMK